MRMATFLRPEVLTMRTSTKHQPTIRLEEVKIQGRRIHLRGEVELHLPLPAQDERLPATLERAVEDAGQRLKRLLFRQALQQADLQLLLRCLRGKRGEDFRRRGSATYTFKTVFGTVKVRRARLQNKDTGATHQPAARAWQTPQQVCLTAGLRQAACDAMLAQSAQNALGSVQATAGESGLLCKAELVKIVHQEGQALRQAAAQRAEQALAEHPQAKDLLLPAVAPPHPDELPTTAEDAAVDPEASGEAAEPAKPLGFPGSKVTAEAVASEGPRRVDEGWVVVQPDGVITHAQPQTGNKRLQSYTAVVLLAGLTWHFAAASPQGLVGEVAGLLAALGVAEGKRRLLFVADGARWIREWSEGLQLEGKAMLVCWYHLVKHTEQLLSLACRGRQHRREVQEPVLQHLWHGRVQQAVELLRQKRGQMKKPEALEELVGYLEARKPYLVDYAARKEAGLWIASNRVEKFNDQAIAARCKHQGMAWTQEGVEALARLQATKRNGELGHFRKRGELPGWHEPQLQQAA
jgi:Uncharacterised protein family (UPF0236)